MQDFLFHLRPKLKKSSLFHLILKNFILFLFFTHEGARRLIISRFVRRYSTAANRIDLMEIVPCIFVTLVVRRRCSCVDQACVDVPQRSPSAVCTACRLPARGRSASPTCRALRAHS